VVRARKLSASTALVHCGVAVAVGGIRDIYPWAGGQRARLPLVICLAGGLLKQEGLPSDVLSRVYGRSAAGTVFEARGDPVRGGARTDWGGKTLAHGAFYRSFRYTWGARPLSGGWWWRKRTRRQRVPVLDEWIQHFAKACRRGGDLTSLVDAPQRTCKQQLLPAGRLREALGR